MCLLILNCTPAIVTFIDRVKSMVHIFKSESLWAAALASCCEQMALQTRIGTLHRVPRWKFGVFMYFEGDAAASVATHVSFVIYLTSFIVYFYVSANEQYQDQTLSSAL